MIENKTEIFKDIVDIMSNDYSGCEDKKALNHPEKYVITDGMDDAAFVKTVQSYLLDFQDHHLRFQEKSGKASSNGFSVRRYEDKLYVTETAQERELAVGDIIVSIDGVGIPALAGLHRKELFDDIYERQEWGNVLVNATKCAVRRHGTEFEFTIKQYDRVPMPRVYSFKQLNDENCLLTLSSFADGAAINSLLRENHETIIHSKNLIIDVRRNEGGSDAAFFPLLSHVFPRKTMFLDLSADPDAMLLNCTERNCDLMKETYTNVLEGRGVIRAQVDDNTRRFFEEQLLFLKENYGKGFAICRDSDFEIDGKPTPVNVIILSDCYCGSAGDVFVQLSKKSSKVKVVGRNTLGITDYSNGVLKDYSDCFLLYPISKMTKNHINGIGVPVDVYIPWTPEHLVKDVDLEKALSMV